MNALSSPHAVSPSGNRSEPSGPPIPLLFLIDQYVTGGSQTQLFTTVTLLDRSKWAPEVFTFVADDRWRERFAAAGIPLTILPRRWKVDPAGVLALRRVLRQRGPCVLHTWMNAANLHGLLAAWGVSSCRLILGVLSSRFSGQSEADGSRWWRPVSFVLHAVLRWIAVRCGIPVLTNAAAIARELVPEGLPPEMIGIVHNTVPVPASGAGAGPADTNPRVAPDVETRGATKEPPRPPSSGEPQPAPFEIVAVFRLVPRKGGDVLIQALGDLPDHVRVTFVGDGPDRARLEGLAEWLGLRTRVSFAGNQSSVQPFLQRAHVFCLPSLEGEGVSNALVEAMGTGLACISTESGGSPEVITSGIDGLLVPPGDHRALAAAIASLLADPDLADRLRVQARRTYAQRFSLETMAERMDQVYTGVWRDGRLPRELTLAGWDAQPSNAPESHAISSFQEPSP